MYIWTNRYNGKKYIGSHKGHPDDGYIGSGEVFLRAVNKYGIDAFDRSIIGFAESDDELKRMESEQLYAVDAKNNPEYYNLTNACCRGSFGLNEKVRVWMRENKHKRVFQFDLSGNFIRVFESLTEASASIPRSSASNIKYTCDGRFQQAYGFRWSWIEELKPFVRKTKHGRKMVMTSDGTFPSLQAAMRHHGLKSHKEVHAKCVSDERWKIL